MFKLGTHARMGLAEPCHVLGPRLPSLRYCHACALDSTPSSAVSHTSLSMRSAPGCVQCPFPSQEAQGQLLFHIAFSVVEGQVMSSFCFTVIMTLIIAQALLCWASSKASSLCCDRHLLQILLPTFPVKHCIAFHTDRLGSMRCSNNSRTAWWALSATQTLG